MTQFGNWAVVAGLVTALTSCGGGTDPVESANRELRRFPEYSIIVENLEVKGGMFADYFLTLRLLTASGSRVDGVDTLIHNQRVESYEVSESVYARYENYLGMVVASKSLDGSTTSARQAYPNGYQYVGNPGYGSWGAGGFWQFYGQYAFMSQMMGGWGVNRNDYDNYRSNRGRGSPYYGPVSNGRQTFGSNGLQTEKSRPSFYKRHKQRSASGRGSTRAGGSSRWGRGK